MQECVNVVYSHRHSNPPQKLVDPTHIALIYLYSYEPLCRVLNILVENETISAIRKSALTPILYKLVIEEGKIRTTVNWLKALYGKDIYCGSGTLRGGFVECEWEHKNYRMCSKHSELLADALLDIETNSQKNIHRCQT